MKTTSGHCLACGAQIAISAAGNLVKWTPAVGYVQRVEMLEATIAELMGRLALLEQIAWATADASGALLVRVEDLERDRVGHTKGA